MPRYLSTKEVATFLGLSPRTLENLRARNGGPNYIKLGTSKASRVRYRLGEVMRWAEQIATKRKLEPSSRDLPRAPRAPLQCKPKIKFSSPESRPTEKKSDAAQARHQTAPRRPDSPLIPTRPQVQVASRQPTDPNPPVTREDIKFCIVFIANAIQRGRTELLPLLERLEREYVTACQADPAAYAERVLKRIAD